MNDDITACLMIQQFEFRSDQSKMLLRIPQASIAKAVLLITLTEHFFAVIRSTLLNVTDFVPAFNLQIREKENNPYEQLTMVQLTHFIMIDAFSSPEPKAHMVSLYDSKGVSRRRRSHFQT